MPCGGRLPRAATVGQRFLRSVLPDDQEERRRTSSPALARANPCPSGSGGRNGGSVCGYRDFFATPAGTAVPGTTRRQPRRTVYLYIVVLGVNARFCRVEGISASSTRAALALACGLILAATRAGVLNPGRAQAVVPPGEMLRVQQLPPAVIRSPADSPAARRMACMAAVSSSRVTSCPGGAGA